MTTPPPTLPALRTAIWAGSIPLQIRLARADCTTYDQSDAYLLYAPRISYLPLLLPRIHAFFRGSGALIDASVPAAAGWFAVADDGAGTSTGTGAVAEGAQAEGGEVPLKWHYPLGLLFDLYSRAKEQLVAETHGRREAVPLTSGQAAAAAADEAGVLPWRITVHFSAWPTDVLVPLDDAGRVMQSAFNNSVKEASFIRHGSGKVIMSLGKEATEQLWQAVCSADGEMYAAANQQVVHPKGEALRHIPIKIYLPALAADHDPEMQPKPGHLRVVQALVTPKLQSRQVQTLGTALNSLMPALFPSRRSPLLAYPVLHGAIVPLSVGIQDLAEYCAYADGFLHITIAMMG